MAQQTAVTLARRTWTKLNNADIAVITFQVIAGRVWFAGTSTGTNPTAADPSSIGALLYTAGQGEIAVRLTDLFPGVASVDNLHAWSEDDARISFGHA